ncbi:MAG TPA: hypothetical protein VIM65_19130 [Cyclobacteriaceae bacterium]
MCKSISIISTILLLIVFISCDSYEFPHAPYPVAETNSVSDITASNATFKAHISNYDNTSIIDHGFVWGKNPEHSVSSGKVIDLGIFQTNKGNFNATIEKTFSKDTTYYVRSYIKTTSLTIYGNSILFKGIE